MTSTSLLIYSHLVFPKIFKIIINFDLNLLVSPVHLLCTLQKEKSL